MIRHSALFRLNHASGTAAEQDFLDALAGLAAIPSVTNFQIARETSLKNPYDFAASMEFDGQPAYDGYNDHPIHTALLRDRWIPEVADFMEHDAVPPR